MNLLPERQRGVATPWGMKLAPPAVALAILLVPSLARADEGDEQAPPAPTKVEPTPPPVVEPAPVAPVPLTPPLGPTAAPPPLPPGPGVALGYENGLWGANFAQALRARFPFSDRWGLVVKAAITHPTDHSHNVMPHYGGWKLELFGSSKPILDVARVYGGGGFVVTKKVLGTGGDEDVHYGLGGYFGLEIFMTRHAAFFIEIGGSSNPDATAAGATVTAGLQWYLGH